MPPWGNPCCQEHAGGLSPVAVPLQLPEGTGCSRKGPGSVGLPGSEQGGMYGRMDGWMEGWDRKCHTSFQSPPGGDTVPELPELSPNLTLLRWHMVTIGLHFPLVAAQHQAGDCSRLEITFPHPRAAPCSLPQPLLLGAPLISPHY